MKSQILNRPRYSFTAFLGSRKIVNKRGASGMKFPGSKEELIRLAEKHFASKKGKQNEGRETSL